MNNEFMRIQDAASFLLKKITKKPKVGLILGSGLGVIAEEIQNPTLT
jgi:purine-nucleoside phosphorylase